MTFIPSEEYLNQRKARLEGTVLEYLEDYDGDDRFIRDLRLCVDVWRHEHQQQADLGSSLLNRIK